MAFVGYPAELEPAQWDKNKGVIAKMAGETGLGKSLTELKAAYGGVDQTKLTSGGYGKLGSVEAIDGALAQAKQYYAAKVEPFRTRCRAVQKQAEGVAVKFKANKLIPKSSTEYVQKIVTACDHMAIGFKSLDAEFKTFEASKARLIELHAMTAKTLGSALDNLESACKACLKTPTGDFWINNVRQRNRMVGNSLGNIPEYKVKFWTVWKPLDGMQVKAETPPEGVKSACNKLLAEIPKVRAGM